MTDTYEYEIYRGTANGMWWYDIIQHTPAGISHKYNPVECAYTKWGVKRLAEKHISKRLTPRTTKRERYSYPPRKKVS